mmetsp:Transcript_24943/g.57319  ORF Transcript_24943/g.57319 Transcript_24943/m.57319 type:complete len:365 (+) Transcript_24943:179-1273(+)
MSDDEDDDVPPSRGGTGKTRGSPSKVEQILGGPQGAQRKFDRQSQTWVKKEEEDDDLTTNLRNIARYAGMEKFLPPPRTKPPTGGRGGPGSFVRQDTADSMTGVDEEKEARLEAIEAEIRNRETSQIRMSLINHRKRESKASLQGKARLGPPKVWKGYDVMSNYSKDMTLSAEKPWKHQTALRGFRDQIRTPPDNAPGPGFLTSGATTRGSTGTSAVSVFSQGSPGGMGSPPPEMKEEPQRAKTPHPPGILVLPKQAVYKRDLNGIWRRSYERSSRPPAHPPADVYHVTRRIRVDPLTPPREVDGFKFKTQGPQTEAASSEWTAGSSMLGRIKAQLTEVGLPPERRVDERLERSVQGYLKERSP